MIERRKTREINLGGVRIGGGGPIIVQSMTNTDTRDVDRTVSQIKRLEEAGCEIVRVAVPNRDAAEILDKIKKRISIPLIADIHFDYRLALKAIDRGADGIRINPGNIGDRWKVEEVVKAARDRGIPIRIGVNAGSLKKDIMKKDGHIPSALVKSAEEELSILEDMGFRDIKVSLKASNVLTTIEAYRLFSDRFDYPLHIGISEAGPIFSGSVKSAVGLGILLSEGIGDTIRVSLTADPVEEVRVAYEILRALNLRRHGVNIISCPTCGRCEIDLIGLVREVEKRLMGVKKPLDVAIMGCVVNGPGEAKEADVGIAGGKGIGILFRKGEVIKKIRENELVDAIVEEVKNL